MATKYLDLSGLTYFWGKIKAWAKRFLTSSVNYDTTNKKITYTKYDGTNDAEHVIDVVTAATIVTDGGGRSPYYGTSSTNSDTNTKVVILDVDDDNFFMNTGTMISVKFTNENTVASPTLNVNGKGSVAIKSYGTTGLGATPCAWRANEVVSFVYDGTYWMMLGEKIQPDWNQSNISSPDYIKNKPTYWANQNISISPEYISEPEVKQITINGSTIDSASSEHAIIQYDTTEKCIKFIFD